jgi:hypothetical protein
MSILKRLEASKNEASKKLFAVVAGQRLSGKSSLAGTLPGKTLLLQAAVYESGSKSAVKLSQKLGNDLTILTFNSTLELRDIVKELTADDQFDNIYVDGVGSITDMKMAEPKMIAAAKADVWGAYRVLGDEMRVMLHELKALTYPGKSPKPKNVFVTCALEIKQDKSGAIVDVSLQAKGNIAISEITRLGEAVVTCLAPTPTDKGMSDHRLLTKTDGVFPGRIDGLLPEENSGIVEPANLSVVLKALGL